MNEIILEVGVDARLHARQLLDIAATTDCAVLEGTGLLYVFRFDDVEMLLHDGRLAGVGRSTHHRLRHLVSKACTPTSAERLRVHAARTVNTALDPLIGEGGDLVEALRHVPMAVMCRLLGVPTGLVAEFTLAGLSGVISDVVELRSTNPTDDLISALLHNDLDGDRLSPSEVVAEAVNLLASGHETTAGQIHCSLLTLLQRPEILRLACSEPELIPAIVSETVRLTPSLDGVQRTVLEPIDICGDLRPAGTPVLLCTLTANRDPAVWSQPDRFLPRRFVDSPNARLLSFGAGPHSCLGAAVAKVVLAETVRAVAHHMPILLEDPSVIPWTRSIGRSPARLDVMM